ncbi:MAG: DUF1232 domain-containing protein [Lachnospiraceae bacterium]|nr:DUF1232 domain-containing protein [Lachnospiraceae bacterium]
MTFDLNAAKQAIENGMGEAQELIKDPSRIDALLVSLETALKDVPVAGDILADIPLTISMVKSYITKEYTEVSPKVIISLVSAFVYLLKKKDLIPDSVPLVGRVDDIAVLGFALKFVEPQLKEYAAWRDAKAAGAQAEEATAAPAEEAAPAETAEA